MNMETMHASENSQVSPIEDLLADYRQGKMVILGTKVTYWLLRNALPMNISTLWRHMAVV